MIPYEGSKRKNPLAFKFYNPDKKVLGKPMSEHLPSAIVNQVLFGSFSS